MASTKLSRTAGTPTSSKKFTISFWVKRSEILVQQVMDIYLHTYELMALIDHKFILMMTM